MDYAERVYATELALDVSTSDAQAIVDAQDAKIATLQAQRNDLLAALEEITRACDLLHDDWLTSADTGPDDLGQDAGDAITQARAAIAKARGE